VSTLYIRPDPEQQKEMSTLEGIPGVVYIGLSRFETTGQLYL